MESNKLHKVLQEIFPQVDGRVLRAVAVENCKAADLAAGVVDIAVDVVLTEVIPYLTDQSGPSSSSSERSVVKPSEVAVDADATVRTEDDLLMNATLSDIEQNATSICDAVAGDYQCVLDSDAGHCQLLTEANYDNVEVHGKCVSAESVLCEKSQETDTGSICEQTSDLTTSTVGDLTAVASHMATLHDSVGDSYESFGLDNVKGVHKDSKEEKSDRCLAHGASPSTIESRYSINTSGYENAIAEKADTGDDSALSNMVTRSGQIYSVDVLEGIIADSRSNKNTLFSAMESVISLMREVEFQERAVEQAKRAAAEGGLDILSKVEDLKRMLLHAKEANDMHAGEVFGERAILATEVRELQSRLLSLSEEKDKSLEVLNEMHQTLLLRSEAAEKEIEVAEKEKVEKESSARKALAEQESIMEKVVREANVLKEVAKENAELQDFLVDRGRVVDMLQGEISVICQDVRFLKEKFDKGIPFSKSLSSSQTSCILATSSSFCKSLTTDQVDQMLDQSDSSEIEKKSDSIPSPSEQQVSGVPTDDQTALADEGWEICEW